MDNASIDINKKRASVKYAIIEIEQEGRMNERESAKMNKNTKKELHRIKKKK